MAENNGKASAGIDQGSALVDASMKQEWKAYGERVASYAIKELPAIDKLVIFAFKWLWGKVRKR